MHRIFNLKDHLEKLNHLVAVAESGSISAASRRLKLTQSAISHSLGTLEDTLEVTLLVRKPTGVDLSDAGQILYAYARKMLADLEDIEHKLHHPLDPTSGKLRIGSHETLAIHVFPQILSGFLSSFPNLNVSLTSGRVDTLIRGLMEEEFHVVLTVEPLSHATRIRVPLYSGTIGFFVGAKPLPAYPHLKKSRLTQEEAATVPILTDVDAHIRQGLPILHALAGLGLGLHHLHALNSFEAAMRLAAAGAGIAVVAERNAQELVKNGQLKPIQIQGVSKKEFGSYTICASYLKKNRGNPAIDALIQKLRRSF